MVELVDHLNGYALLLIGSAQDVIPLEATGIEHTGYAWIVWLHGYSPFSGMVRKDSYLPYSLKGKQGADSMQVRLRSPSGLQTLGCVSACLGNSGESDPSTVRGDETIT